MLKFYDCTPAPSPRRARIFMAEKGVEVENIQIDLRSGEQLSQDYLSINPMGTVPALELPDGTLLTENLAIAAYLEATHPEPPLMGTTPEEKAKVMQWNARTEFGALMACAEMLRNTSPAMKDRALPGQQNLAQIPELAERGRTRIGTYWTTMDDQLGHHDYLAGDRYSLADITALVCVDFSKWVKASPLDSHANIRDWHARVSARPSSSA